MEKEEKIQWHQGFFGGIEWELREYRADLTFDKEHELSKKALKIDLLIIRKDSDVEIKVPIGRIFRKYNIIEYKSPDDGLTIDDFFKAIGYLGLYKGLGEIVNEIPAQELTLSFFRYRSPRELFRQLQAMGAELEDQGGGVYAVHGFFHIPVQIVVMRELPKEERSALRLLCHGIEEEDVTELVDNIPHTLQPGDRNNLQAVLEISALANPALFERLKGAKEMSRQAMRIIFGPQYDIDMEDAEAKGEVKGREEGRAQGIQVLVTTLQGLGMDRESVAGQLAGAYALSAEEAEQTVNQYWPSAN